MKARSIRAGSNPARSRGAVAIDSVLWLRLLGTWPKRRLLSKSSDVSKNCDDIDGKSEYECDLENGEYGDFSHAKRATTK